VEVLKPRVEVLLRLLVLLVEIQMVFWAHLNDSFSRVWAGDEKPALIPGVFEIRKRKSAETSSPPFPFNEPETPPEFADIRRKLV
jgi:hypothetical protein